MLMKLDRIWVAARGREGPRIWLKPGSSVTIGRKDTDIVLARRNVSRTHAVLVVAPTRPSESADVAAWPAVTIEDKKSTYGTFVGTAKIAENAPVRLTHGQTFRIGNENNVFVFRLVREKVVVCTSGLRTRARNEIQAVAAQYDIKIVPDFGRDCTHLLMETFQVTAKVVKALSLAKPIITQAWIRAFDGVDPMQFTMPDHAKFLPDAGEMRMWRPTQFLPDPRRGLLFCNIDFIVFSQAERTAVDAVVTASSGRTSLFEFADPAALSELEIEALSRIIDNAPRAIVVSPKDPALGSLADAIRARISCDSITHDQIAIAIINTSVESVVEGHANAAHTQGQIPAATQAPDRPRTPPVFESQLADTQRIPPQPARNQSPPAPARDMPIEPPAPDFTQPLVEVKQEPLDAPRNGGAVDVSSPVAEPSSPQCPSQTVPPSVPLFHSSVVGAAAPAAHSQDPVAQPAAPARSRRTGLEQLLASPKKPPRSSPAKKKTAAASTAASDAREESSAAATLRSPRKAKSKAAEQPVHVSTSSLDDLLPTSIVAKIRQSGRQTTDARSAQETPEVAAASTAARRGRRRLADDLLDDMMNDVGADAGAAAEPERRQELDAEPLHEMDAEVHAPDAATENAAPMEQDGPDLEPKQEHDVPPPLAQYGLPMPSAEHVAPPQRRKRTRGLDLIDMIIEETAMPAIQPPSQHSARSASMQSVREPVRSNGIERFLAFEDSQPQDGAAARSQAPIGSQVGKTTSLAQRLGIAAESAPPSQPAPPAPAAADMIEARAAQESDRGRRAHGEAHHETIEAPHRRARLLDAHAGAPVHGAADIVKDEKQPHRIMSESRIRSLVAQMAATRKRAKAEERRRDEMAAPLGIKGSADQGANNGDDGDSNVVVVLEFDLSEKDSKQPVKNEVAAGHNGGGSQEPPNYKRFRKNTLGGSARQYRKPPEITEFFID
ncbi:hypothetical protein HK105_201298 [Polyrhizophydium stewartii]|uniref:FHA domain-containing protein n=1 Tax=Polyrhizophydium stewartii TaxID=2732419 RepID=A0ABR4NHM5_9FUNG